MQNVQIESFSLTTDAKTLIVKPSSTDFDDIQIDFGFFIDCLIQSGKLDNQVKNDLNGFVVLPCARQWNGKSVAESMEAKEQIDLVRHACTVKTYDFFYELLCSDIAGLYMEGTLQENIQEHIDNGDYVFEELNNEGVDSAVAEAYQDFRREQML